MSIRNIIYLIFSVLPLNQVFSQSDTEATATPAPTESKSIVDLKKAQTNNLPVINPLFAPYKGQWFLQVDATEQRSAYTATVPAQSYSGFSVAESKSRTEYTDIRVMGQAAYGIHDRLALGIRTRFLADRQTQTTSTGIFTSGTSTLPTQPGMYSPEFILQGRLLGINRDEWHVNVIGIYSPGKIGGQSGSQSDFQAGLMVGRNAGVLTFGLVGFAIWSPESTSGGVKVRSRTALSGEMVLQMHLSPFFFNLLGGAFQYVDPSSANDAMSGKVRLVCALEIGAEIQQNVFAKVGYGWLLPVSADQNANGLRMTFQDHGGPAANLTIGARF